MRKKKIIIAFTAAILFSILFSLLYKWARTGNPFSPDTLFYGIIFFLNLIILGSIGYAILSRFSAKSTIQTRKQIIPAFLLFALAALIISLLIISAGVYVFYLVEGLDRSGFIRHLFTVELSSALKQFSIWILLGSAFFFYVIWRKSIEREQQLREENLKYRYRNLRAQINPHFLFNTLNTLSEIVYDDAEKADAYIQQLSGIYRYILENEETDLIPLDQELEFVKKYISLQTERDTDKISLEIDFPGADTYKIIPVSLQLLIENALKHNAMSEEKPLEIRIYQSGDNVVVSNSIQRKNIVNGSTGTGLANLRERIKLITGKELIVKEDTNRFVVYLPINRV